jgi:hypothetical protein
LTQVVAIHLRLERFTPPAGTSLAQVTDDADMPTVASRSRVQEWHQPDPDPDEEQQEGADGEGRVQRFEVLQGLRPA